jgi:uncharacterized spore protein YtfJ
MDLGNLFDKASDNLSVRRAFGAAYEKNGMLIIPVAIVAGGGGGGTEHAQGGNSAVSPDSLPEADAMAHDAAPQNSGRAGAGGGFGGLVLPSGAYVVKGDQVRWVPAVDVTIVALASVIIARVLARTLRGWTPRSAD